MRGSAEELTDRIPDILDGFRDRIVDSGECWSNCLTGTKYRLLRSSWLILVICDSTQTGRGNGSFGRGCFSGCGGCGLCRLFGGRNEPGCVSGRSFGYRFLINHFLFCARGNKPGCVSGIGHYFLPLPFDFPLFMLAAMVAKICCRMGLS